MKEDGKKYAWKLRSNNNNNNLKRNFTQCKQWMWRALVVAFFEPAKIHDELKTVGKDEKIPPFSIGPHMWFNSVKIKWAGRQKYENRSKSMQSTSRQSRDIFWQKQLDCCMICRRIVWLHQMHLFDVLNVAHTHTHDHNALA